jgi:hypothetical protein
MVSRERTLVESKERTKDEIQMTKETRRNEARRNLIDGFALFSDFVLRSSFALRPSPFVLFIPRGRQSPVLAHEASGRR